jgi:hypothetical protein
MNTHPMLFLLCITSGLSAMQKSTEHYQSVGYYRQSAEQRVPSLRFLAAQQLYRSYNLEKVDTGHQQVTNDLLSENVLYMRKDTAQAYVNQECLAYTGEQ